jgi:hypothetical protein
MKKAGRHRHRSTRERAAELGQRANTLLDWLATRPAWAWFVCLGGAGLVLLLAIVLVLRTVVAPEGAPARTPTPAQDRLLPNP